MSRGLVKSEKTVLGMLEIKYELCGTEKVTVDKKFVQKYEIEADLYDEFEDKVL